MREGGTFVILIEHPPGNIVCCNSANYLPNRLQGISSDIVLLSIAQVPKNISAYIHETVDMVHASQVFAIHGDNFFQPLTQYPSSLPLVTNVPKFFHQFHLLRPKISLYTLPIGTPQILYP